MTDTVDEARLRRIKELEAEGKRPQDAPDKQFQKPIFTTALNK